MEFARQKLAESLSGFFLHVHAGQFLDAGRSLELTLAFSNEASSAVADRHFWGLLFRAF